MQRVDFTCWHAMLRCALRCVNRGRTAYGAGNGFHACPESPGHLITTQIRCLHKCLQMTQLFTGATPVINPFRPTVGATPPDIIGRTGVLNEFAYGIDIRSGTLELLSIFTGAHGIGKTVMLGVAEDLARAKGWVVISETATVRASNSRRRWPSRPPMPPTATLSSSNTLATTGESWPKSGAAPSTRTTWKRRRGPPSATPAWLLRPRGPRHRKKTWTSSWSWTRTLRQSTRSGCAWG